MNRITLSNLKVDPKTLAVMHARARKARAEVVHNLVVGLIRRLSPRLTLGRLTAHWG